MFWLVFLIAVLSDQLTKLAAPLYFEVVLNSGISFGWLNFLPSGLMNLLLIISIIIVANVWQRHWRRYHVISGLFWAGALSNLFDRVLLGGVVDWIQLPFSSMRNNLADVYLSVALLLLVIKELRNHNEN